MMQKIKGLWNESVIDIGSKIADVLLYGFLLALTIKPVMLAWQTNHDITKRMIAVGFVYGWVLFSLLRYLKNRFKRRYLPSWEIRSSISGLRTYVKYRDIHGNRAFWDRTIFEDIRRLNNALAAAYPDSNIPVMTDADRDPEDSEKIKKSETAILDISQI